MPGVFNAADKDTTQNGCVFGSVTLDFISLWNLKFLAYLLNALNVSLCVPFHIQMCISCVCNYCSLQWTGVFRQCYAVGCSARHREGGGNYFRFPKNPVRRVHKIIEQIYDHLFICHTTHFRCQTRLINFYILTLV